MKKICLLFIVLGFCILGKSQNQDSCVLKRSNVYIEFGGNALFYSMNYDNIIFHTKYIKVTVGSGISYIPPYGGANIFGNFLVLSPNANFLIGKVHHLELGGGVSFLLHEDDYMIPLRIGYRYQQPSGGFLFRIGFTPIFSDFLYPIVGISFGYTMK